MDKMLPHKTLPVSEFNGFKPRLKTHKNRFLCQYKNTILSETNHI